MQTVYCAAGCLTWFPHLINPWQNFYVIIVVSSYALVPISHCQAEAFYLDLKRSGLEQPY